MFNERNEIMGDALAELERDEAFREAEDAEPTWAALMNESPLTLARDALANLVAALDFNREPRD